jgi:hypothetical protein
MIAIKTMLIGGVAALGTATAGGVTYATVSNDSPSTPAVVKALPSKAAAAPSSLPRPGSVPTDVAKRLQTKVPAGVPTALPTGKVPALPALDCAKVPAAAPASATGNGSLGLPTGLTYTGTKTATFTVDGQKVCSTVQTWQGRAGQWIQARRIKGRATPEQIRQALDLPAMSPVTLSGFDAWQSPLGTQGSGYIFWSTGPGQAELVAATPVYTFQLSDLATKLHKLH